MAQDPSTLVLPFHTQGVALAGGQGGCSPGLHPRVVGKGGEGAAHLCPAGAPTQLSLFPRILTQGCVYWLLDSKEERETDTSMRGHVCERETALCCLPGAPDPGGA